MPRRARSVKWIPDAGVCRSRRLGGFIRGGRGKPRPYGAGGTTELGLTISQLSTLNSYNGRRMRAALLVLGGFVVAGAILCAVAVRSTFPGESGSVRVAGIAGPIRIETDTLGVPTIRAASPADATFGLGYVHARDRLWQMEFQRRIGSGRLSEILGERLVPTDRFLRTVGFRRAAADALRAL